MTAKPPSDSNCLYLLARAAAPEIRVRVASGICQSDGVRLDDWLEATLDLLSSDPSMRVRRALIAAFPRVMRRLTGLERTSIIARWAVSPSADQRLAAAKALATRLPVLWDDVILDELVRDPVPAVRKAARIAAERRGVALEHVSRERSPGRTTFGSTNDME